jgi:hypothetical protein
MIGGVAGPLAPRTAIGAFGNYEFMKKLVKQNKKGKNCAVFCFAGKRKIFFIYL